MPTEHEFKFILKLNCEDNLIKIAKKHLCISQGYLLASKGISLRLRSSQSGEMYKSTLIPKNDFRYEINFKSNTSKRIIEIENKIDKRDFDDLWQQCLNKLIKYRHIVKDKMDNSWEIDFFKDYNNENYFAMAELELPEGQSPKFIPDFIKSNLIYEVPLTDTRFSSKLIADVRYAIEINKSLLRG